ncbi:cyclopropane-fatty-acyl-phospholipid synthase [Vibrio hannami]|uniref:SAM-dependent methyltransferase n=1 Tax=Vibrio hannami TaxID=2717094 RepID=UPI00240FC6D9|nr:cyclopropane-fatty-acyl-phospholipid synthase family protein [Vibrio hannami]MDG3087672.1 cyclopropane-fatty-acyl-phospholipid synthase [Vibrio hannami]
MYESISVASINELSVSQKNARALIFKLLPNIQHGSLTIIENYLSGRELRSNDDDKRYIKTERFGSESGIHAVIEIKHPDFFCTLLKGGSIAVGESYMDGRWDSTDLTTLMELMAKNLPLIDKLEASTGRLAMLVNKFKHWLNKNTVKNSKKNIEAHYDLGNDLYEQFLDSKMLYSSGIYLGVNDSLEQAQINKMERLCQQLQLKASDEVIEIGSGWGSMAIYMAEHYGCHVTTTTISEEQYEYARKRIEESGMGNKITLLKEDYRNLKGKYDKLVSIEMVEAVGKAFLPSYVHQCNELLKPGGLMAIQAITIADQRYEAYSKRVDFIQKYIFPGGFLPSVTALVNTATKNSELMLNNAEDIGADYARTLADWHGRFLNSLDRVLSLGYDHRFIRMWRYYLSYCEGGFLAQSISTVQLTFRKAG